MKPISLPSRSLVSRRCLFALAIGLCSCSGGGGDAAPPDGVARLTLRPASLELAPGATQQFAALRDEQPVVVDWSLVSGPGTLSVDGLYSAPTTVTETVSAVVRAVARDDARVRADATVLVRAAAIGDADLLGAALAFTGPEAITMRRQELVSESLTKALLAGRLSGFGGYVGYGTIAATQNGVEWQPVPGDRLVVHFQDGSRRDYAFARLAGDPTLLLRYDHDIEVTVSEGAEFSLHFTQERRGNEVQIAIDGTMLFEGSSVQIDLTSREMVVRDAGSGGDVDYQADEVLTGSLRLPGVEVTVDEQGRYQAAFTPNSRPHLNRFVVHHDRQCRSSFVVGNQRTQLQDGQLVRILTNGAPSEVSGWIASAQLTRNGARVGQIASILEGRVLSAVVQLGGRSREVLRAEF